MVQERKDGRRGDNPLAAIIECTSLWRAQCVRTDNGRLFRAHTFRGIRPPAGCHPSHPGNEASPFSQRRRRAAGGEDTHTARFPQGPRTRRIPSIQPHAEAAQLLAPNGAGPKRAGVAHSTAPISPRCLFIRPRHDIPAHATRRPPRKARIQLRWTAHRQAGPASSDARAGTRRRKWT